MVERDRIAALGAVLFAAGGPVACERLAALLEILPEELEPLLGELERRARTIGLILLWHGDQVQLATLPEVGPLITSFLGNESSRLSAAALETLAIIAYLQPVTRAEIEAIRGVDCSTALQTLLAHGLAEPIGRRSGPGQPVEYGTTTLFLERFGLVNLTALPPLPAELRELLLARRSTH